MTEDAKNKVAVIAMGVMVVGYLGFILWMALDQKKFEAKLQETLPIPVEDVDG